MGGQKQALQSQAVCNADPFLQDPAEMLPFFNLQSLMDDRVMGMCCQNETMPIFDQTKPLRGPAAVLCGNRMICVFYHFTVKASNPIIMSPNRLEFYTAATYTIECYAEKFNNGMDHQYRGKSMEMTVGDRQ